MHRHGLATIIFICIEFAFVHDIRILYNMKRFIILIVSCDNVLPIRLAICNFKFPLDTPF